MSTYFFNPFKSPYRCHYILLELAYKFSVFHWIPSTFESPSGHHHDACIFKKYNSAFIYAVVTFILNKVLFIATVAKKHLSVMHLSDTRSITQHLKNT